VWLLLSLAVAPVVNEVLATVVAATRTAPAVVEGRLALALAVPEVVGTLSFVSGTFPSGAAPGWMVALAIVYAALWLFLSGGILDRLARDRPVRTAAFFAACGEYFVRFLRLSPFILGLYWAVFGVVDFAARAAPEMIGSRRDLLLIGSALLIDLLVDFAKVRMVVEDRRSALGALLAGARFIRRNAIGTLALYLIALSSVMMIVSIWVRLSGSGPSASWAALLATQVLLVVRLWAGLAFSAAELTWFQSRLAHAGYTAAPPLRWPDSPAVEAIRNLTRRD
jgi:hypothetical protein